MHTFAVLDSVAVNDIRTGGMKDFPYILAVVVVDEKVEVLTTEGSVTLEKADFPPSGDGVVPEFDAVSIEDYGQTLCFGAYGASAQSLMYK